jgi:hypothetical protein
MITCSREHLERQLRAFGEDAAADNFLSLPEDRVRRIQERAMHYACQGDTPTGRPMLIDKALAMAAVEVIEGTSRDLSRKRRRY